MKKVFLLLLFLVISHSHGIAQQNKPMYVSPLPDSKLNSRSSTIIVRYSEDIEQLMVTKDLFRVVGSEQGVYEGTTRLSSEKRTIIFKPNRQYKPNENITVYFAGDNVSLNDPDVEPFSFVFSVTPLSEPLYYNSFTETETNTALFKSETNAGGGLPRMHAEIIDNPSPGLFFITNYPDGRAMDTDDTFVMTIDNTGEISHYKEIAKEGYDFKMLPNGYLAYAELLGRDNARILARWVVLNQAFEEVDSYQMKNGYTSDAHDFQMLPNGHTLMFAYDPQPVDMSTIVTDGKPEAIVVGAVIQELDQDKNVIFQWRTWDHIDISDTYLKLNHSYIDFAHLNTVELDDDGMILLSFKNLNQFIKVDRQTGEIIWRLGGKRNDFTFINEHEENAPVYFSRQHDIRRIENGNITFFDNGNDHKKRLSRGVEYQLDEENMIATLVWDFYHPANVYSFAQGSTQRLPNGNTLIGWGVASWIVGKPVFTEVTPDGKIAFDMYFDDAHSSYRAYKFPWDVNTPDITVTIDNPVQDEKYFMENSQIETGVSFVFANIENTIDASITFSRIQRAPKDLAFPNETPIVYPVTYRLQYVNSGDVSGVISFDPKKLTFPNDPEQITIYGFDSTKNNPYEALQTSVNKVNRHIEAEFTNHQKFILTYPDVTQIPNPPLLVFPADSQLVNSEDTLEIKWNPEGIARTFTLQVATDSLFTQTIVDADSLSESKYMFSDLVKERTYYWRVRAENFNGVSDWSETRIFTPVKPFIKILYPNGGESIYSRGNLNILWETNVTDYFQVSLHNDEDFVLSISGGVISRYGYQWDIDNIIPNADNYRIKVSSLSDRSLMDFSDSTFSFIDTITEIVDAESPQIFSLDQNFPNPFNPKTHITFALPEAGYTELKVFTMNAEIIEVLMSEYLSEGSYTIDFEADGLSSGVYLYAIYIDGKMMDTKKMLLMK